MAKKTTPYALKFGHPTPFRRTIDIGTSKNPNKVQFVFEPGQIYHLTEAEIAKLDREISTGLLVNPEFDKKGRFRPTSPASSADSKARIAELEAEVERLSTQVAEYESLLNESTGSDTPDVVTTEDSGDGDLEHKD